MSGNNVQSNTALIGLYIDGDGQLAAIGLDVAASMVGEAMVGESVPQSP